MVCYTDRFKISEGAGVFRWDSKWRQRSFWLGLDTAVFLPEMYAIMVCVMGHTGRSSRVLSGSQAANKSIDIFQMKSKLFLISNFRRVLNVVCFLLGYSRASEFCVPTFRNTLVCSIFIGRWLCEEPPPYEVGTDGVFQNVSTQNSDAREWPRRKHTSLN